MKTLRCLIAFSLGTVSPFSFAATNGLDSKFGTGGVVLLGPTPVTAQSMERIESITVQDDGKLIVGGRSLFDDGEGPVIVVPAVGRVNADGSWDTTFADHGLFRLPSGTASAPMGGKIDNIAQMSNGSLVAEGGALIDGGSTYSTCTLLFKLDSSGALDTAFGSDHAGSFCFDFGTSSTRNGHFSGLRIGNDDSFYMTAPTTLDHGAVAHFDAEGVLESDYGVSGIAALPTGVFTSLLNQQTDGRVLVTGVKLLGSTIHDQLAVVRLQTDGSIDTSYGDKGVFVTDTQTDAVVSSTSSVIDNKGRLLIANNDYDGADYMQYRFFRATDSGASDLTYNSAGQQPGSPGYAAPVVSGSLNIDQVISTLVLPDGHIFAVGDAQDSASQDESSNIAILRLNDDSSYDTSFGDSTHPGWASINIGPADAQNFVNAMAGDSQGHAFIAASAIDAADHPCPLILRIVTDRLFDGVFDSTLLASTCPQ